ncbi:30S ribosomal protein S5 [Patescibacteria group bacterium]|nr:30S ribosomal protein S5 [Patescibacteria group bacterium]
MFERKERQQEKDDLIRRVIQIKRVSKKTKGGNRLGFTALVAVGDGKGHVGVTACHAKDVFLAIQKANHKAKGKMQEIRLVHEHRTIPHYVEIKNGAAHVLLKPAPAGTGIILGGAMRAVAEAAGIKNIVGKNLGTRNKKNTADAMMIALAQLKGKEERLVGKKRKAQSPASPASARRRRDGPAGGSKRKTK